MAVATAIRAAACDSVKLNPKLAMAASPADSRAMMEDLMAVDLGVSTGRSPEGSPPGPDVMGWDAEGDKSTPGLDRSGQRQVGVSPGPGALGG